ncbi:hypothetical protein E4T44_08205 [Aureobasidium sp. EXF-8845]|nr:hypothetical protein E4T44_08205 [Aureobasidium sp. EXF-8845]KAI4850497.1 hypothetical protein E4T45_05470 [Aureobasidium sp. EXF-8846]
MYFLTSTAIGFALSSTLASAASCSSYTPSRERYTQPGIRTTIISKGIVCDTNCRVDIGGYVTDARSLNITVDSSDPIYQLISDVAKLTFNNTVTRWVDLTSSPTAPQSWPIANGTAGYVGFTANHHCTAGKLSGCDSSALEDVFVEACTPYIVADELSGTIGAIATDRSTAEAVTCNPANTTAAKNGNFSNSCSATDSQPGTGAAARMGDASMALLVGSLAIAVFGFGSL